MRPPEPCIRGRCWSPTACNGWGYCRERNLKYPGGRPPEATIAALRNQAIVLRAVADRTKGGDDGR